MVELTRIVRFHIDGTESPSGLNGYAGRPPVASLSPMVEALITLRGEPDKVTHYVLDIKAFDQWANVHIFPHLKQGFAGDAVQSAMHNAFEAGSHLPHELVALELRLTPYAAFKLERDMPTTPLTLTFTQTYDFAAAHHLWANGADESRNRELYGKCAGIHGHNYQLEVVIEPSSTNPIPTETLDRVVKQHLLDVWDHRVLNELEDFQVVPPSVERIAQQAAIRLQGPLAACDLKLREISVSETDRTSARVRLG
ncbi:MAG: hypothetical protein CMJ28_06785 [Phycisphaerae bacterium]|nr:hypothetical protein [Phycisphaerae bacterium]